MLTMLTTHISRQKRALDLTPSLFRPDRQTMTPSAQCSNVFVLLSWRRQRRGAWAVLNHAHSLTAPRRSSLGLAQRARSPPPPPPPFPPLLHRLSGRGGLGSEVPLYSCVPWLFGDCLSAWDEWQTEGGCRLDLSCKLTGVSLSVCVYNYYEL